MRTMPFLNFFFQNEKKKRNISCEKYGTDYSRLKLKIVNVYASEKERNTFNKKVPNAIRIIEALIIAIIFIMAANFQFFFVSGLMENLVVSLP